MLPRRARRATLPLLLIVLVGWVTACGGGAADEVSTGAEPGASVPSSETTPTAAAPTTTAQPTTSIPAPAATTTPATATTVASGTDGSVVPGLTASELQAALAIPPSSGVRAVAGPTAEVVRVPGEPPRWRVRIPGPFPVRAARVEVLVGDEVIGEGVVAGDLSSLSTIAVDPASLTAGAAVSYRWEGGDPVAAGRLAVIR